MCLREFSASPFAKATEDTCRLVIFPLRGKGFYVRPAGHTYLRVIMNNKESESLLLTRQGEELAERQLRHREVIVGRKPMAKHWPDEEESHKRRSRWMRGRRGPKSNTCTENVDVDAAGISVKVGVHYPGRSLVNSGNGLPEPRGIGGSAREVSRGHSSPNRSGTKDRTSRRQRGTQP